MKVLVIEDDDGTADEIVAMHHEAHDECFIASSVCAGLVTFSSDRVQVSRAIDTLGLLPTEDLTKDPLSFAFDIAR